MNTALDAELLHALCDALPDALLLVASDGRITRANHAAEQLLGYAKDELQGLEVDALVPSAVRPQHAALRRSYAAAPRRRPMGLEMELAARRKDGSEVLVEIALSPLQGHEPPQVVVSMRDVSHYPRVRQALRRLRYSEHLAQIGRLVVDAKEPQSVLLQVPAITTQALVADAAMLYLHDGSGSGTGAGASFRLVSAVGLPDANPPDRRYSTEETGLGAAMPLGCTAAGMRSKLAAPLSDRGQTIGVLVACSGAEQHFGADEQRFLESLANLLATGVQRARSDEALAHAQRLESVGQLTGGIAHDFNNLLTIILGNLQVLEAFQPQGDGAHGQQLVAAATRAAHRGAELTGKLLAFSRRQLLQPSAVDVPQMLHSLAGMLRRTLDQRIVIEVDVPPSCPPVRADPGQLESALLNVAINARDAMPDGGTLRFDARPCAALPEALQDAPNDQQADDEGFVAISVSDTGSGMSEAVRQRAFEPFFTTKEPGRGTGLGLATVYGFARQSRGAVALRSAPGAGTTLSLVLPQPPRSAGDVPTGPAGGPASAAPAQALPSGLKVLLVEDDAEVREVVRGFLTSLQCVVTAAASGEQALLTLGAQGRFEALLSDVALGAGMRGTRLAALAQQRQPGLAVLLMSGYSADLLDGDQGEPLRWELLRKPCSREALAAALARVLAQRDTRA
jgi:PAS domain S-box-containing protein